jgi:hypothetical protein
MLTYWIILTKSFCNFKEDINTKNDIKNAIRYYNDQFFWDLRNISTRYEQKIELIIKLHRQMICQGNFSMGIDI